MISELKRPLRLTILATAAFFLWEGSLGAAGIIHSDEVKNPLRPGVWDNSVYLGDRLVSRPLHAYLCTSTRTEPFSPSIFPAEHFGRMILHEFEVADRIRRLSDGSFEVTGGRGTVHGGDVVYTHIVSLQVDDHYEDLLTVKDHARTHPKSHTYLGRGHWVAPCPEKAK